VGTGSESDQEKPRLGIAECGNGESPVGFVPVSGTASLRDFPAMGAQARTTLAASDLLRDATKLRNRFPFARIEVSKRVSSDG
jgi:hypothetical protein